MSTSNRQMPAPAASEKPAPVEEAKVEQKPKFGPPTPATVKEVAPVSKGGIAVVAKRPGFYRGSRRVVGDEFTVSKMEHVGSWMALKDPQAEKARQERLALEKKKKKLEQE